MACYLHRDVRRRVDLHVILGHLEYLSTLR